MDIGRRLIVSQAARRGPYNDGATPRPLVKAASPRLPIGLVPADAAFDSESNHQYIRHHIGAARRSRQRALVERLFSSVKRRLSARAPGRSLYAPRTPALWLGLAEDLYRLEACRLHGHLTVEDVNRAKWLVGKVPKDGSLPLARGGFQLQVFTSSLERRSNAPTLQRRQGNT
jgi:hypothetical protein